MSHKITFNTDMTDQVVMQSALDKLGWAHRSQANNIYIESGPLSMGSFNMRTGTFHGDSDRHHETLLGEFGQVYGECMWMKRLDDRGGYLESREVLQDGTVRLTVQVTEA